MRNGEKLTRRTKIIHFWMKLMDGMYLLMGSVWIMQISKEFVCSFIGNKLMGKVDMYEYL